MELGIIAAMSDEGRALTGGPVPAGAPVQFRRGAVLLVSGIGPERAGAAARILIENGAGALMSWGFACSLQRDISPGEIVIPGRVIAADGSIHAADPFWQERLLRRMRLHLTVSGGALAESFRIMPDYSAKEALGRETGAVASDMESASIGAAALKAGIPFLAVRAVTDTMEMRVPPCAGDCVDRLGRIRPLLLLKGLLQSPADLPDVIRLGRNFRAARRSLKALAAHGGELFCLKE